jgi:hypothetical protein
MISDRLVPVSYEIEVGPGYKAPGCELTLFVHFVDESGKKLFQDDHVPEPPSSRWAPGQKLSYQRLLALPIFEKDTLFRTLAGLYCVERPEQPYELRGTPWKPGESRYEVAAGKLRPYVRPLSDELIGYEGWHGEEYDIPQRLSWRWMGESAKLILANQAKDAVLYLEGRVDPKIFGEPSTLRLRLNGQPLGQTRTGENGHFRAIYHIRPEQLGNETTAVLELEADRTFVPKEKGMSDDARTLGLMVTQVYFGPDTELTRGLAPLAGQEDFAPPAGGETAAEAQAPAATGLEDAGAGDPQGEPAAAGTPEPGSPS